MASTRRLVPRRLLDQREFFDEVLHPRRVDVERQDGNAEAAGLLEDQALGIHARVVGEDAGQERRRVMPLQPRRLVGGQRERGGVGLAEAEGRERLQHLPDVVDDALLVSALQRGRDEPAAHVLLALRRAERPARLVAVGVGAAGHDRDDLDDLLVEDHDAAGLGERRDEVGVQIAGVSPAVAGAEERHHHVGLHRPGPEQADVDDDVVELGRPELAHQLALARRLDLETAEGLGAADHVVDGRVVEGGEGVQVDALAGGALDLVDRVRHRALHADAQHVELEQTDVLDVLLVELAHRIVAEGPLDGRAVEEGGVREQHPAGMQRDVPRQAVQALDQLEQRLQLGVAQVGRAQLGQVAQRVPGVAGADVRERLGDRVDVAGRQAHRSPDIADRVPDAVGVHHRHARHPLGAERVEDHVVDVGAPGRLDVDVDVGQRAAQRRQEPLHDQVVADRVDARDAQRVVDQAARPRAACRDADAEAPDVVDHPRDRQEVRREPELLDDAELVVETLPHLLVRDAVAPVHPRLAARAQFGERVVDRVVSTSSTSGGPVDRACRDFELGQVDLAEADVGVRVEPAADRQVARRPEEPGRPPSPRDAADLFGDADHLLATLEVALGVTPVDVAGVEGHEPAGGVQDVGDRGVRAARHAHRVREDAGDAVGVRERQHAAGERRRSHDGAAP